MHLIKQAEAVNINANEPTSTPIIMALRTLVAANVIAKSITAVRMVSSMPASISGIESQEQPFLKERIPTEVTSNIARYTTAIPNATHKNAVETVIIAVKLKIAAVMPTITLAAIANKVQSNLVLQLQFLIFFHLYNNI